MFPALHPLDDPPAKSLHEDQEVDCETNAMMRIRETPIWANGKVPEYEYHRRQDDGEYLEGYVYSKSQKGSSMIIAGNEYSGGDYANEGNGGDDAMRCDEASIFWKRSKTVTHT